MPTRVERLAALVATVEADADASLALAETVVADVDGHPSRRAAAVADALGMFDLLDRAKERHAAELAAGGAS